MSHHDKFWEKFGKKVRQHEPEAYSDGDWKAMEQLLGKSERPASWLNWKLLSLVLAAIAFGYLAGAHFGIPNVPAELGAFPIPEHAIAINSISPISDEPSAIPAEPANGQVIRRNNRNSRFNTADRAIQRKNAPGRAIEKGREALLPPSTAIPIMAEPRPMATEANQQNKPGEAPAPENDRPHNAPGLQGVTQRPVLSFLPLAQAQVEEVALKETAMPTGFSETSPPKRGGFYSGFLLGGNLSITSSGNAGHSLYPFGGFFAGFQFHPRWAVQAEAHLKYVDNLSVNYEQTMKLESNNGFYFSQVSRGVLEKSFLSLEMPLEAKYRLHPQWSLMAGLRPALIMENAFSSLDQNAQDISAGPMAGAGQGRSAGSSNRELRAFDLGATVALEWAFHRRWAINTRFTRGLVDLSPVQAFNLDERHFNTGVQLSIRRKF